MHLYACISSIATVTSYAVLFSFLLFRPANGVAPTEDLTAYESMLLGEQNHIQPSGNLPTGAINPHRVGVLTPLMRNIRKLRGTSTQEDLRHFAHKADQRAKKKFQGEYGRAKTKPDYATYENVKDVLENRLLGDAPKDEKDKKIEIARKHYDGWKKNYPKRMDWFHYQERIDAREEKKQKLVALRKQDKKKWRMQ